MMNQEHTSGDRKTDNREQRLAKQLRDNLKRRKDQARARSRSTDQTRPDPSDKPTAHGISGVVPKCER
ncbi:MAG: hypothetical protein V3V97_21500 [Hyphomicrobiaceae bacterium]